MKTITNPVWKDTVNGWGGSSRCVYQTFEVEASDVNFSRPHYRGYRHSTHAFTNKDVGRKIEVLTDGTGWTCWTFTS